MRHVLCIGDPILEQRAWLQAAVEASGLSPTALARKAGVAQTTVTRLLNNRAPVHALNAHSLASIERASGVPFGAPTPQRRPAALVEREAEAFQPDAAAPYTAIVRSATQALNAIDPWILRSRALDTANIVPGDILLVDNDKVMIRGVVVATIRPRTGRAAA